MRIVGQRIAHESAYGHVTGRARYTDDNAVCLPGVLHAWPVMAPHAHALLTRLNAEPALSAPGVVATLTTADVPGAGDSGAKRHDEPMFPTEVMHHSQAVAWVLGESIEAARLGAARVEAEYDPLRTILTIEEAIEASSFHDRPFRISRGDAAMALDASPHRIAGDLFIGGQEHFYLETQAALARLDVSGDIVVESGTQNPSGTQDIIARVLGVPRNRVIVECTRMGGAFGGKEVQASPWAAIAALGAWKTQRPVRVRLPRKLDMALTGKRHPLLARFDVGFEGNGTLRAVRLTLYFDGGWSLDLSGPALLGALLHCDNVYRIPALDASGWIAKTHKTSQTAFRGFGAPQGMVVIEEILDRVARTLDIEPHVVRERNFYREGDVTHYGQSVRDAARIRRIWEQLKEISSFDARRKEIARFNTSSRHARRGIAITPIKLGIAFTAKFMNQAGALVLMYRDGSVQVNHGGTEMGQGLQTKIRQIAAESMGVELQQVRMMSTRTDKVPNTSATAASASTDLNGAAVVVACRQIVERLRPIAAELLKCAKSEIRFEGGLARGPGGCLPLADIAESAYTRRIALFAYGYYRTPDLSFDIEAGRGEPFHYFSYGASVSEVEVDGLTGVHRILRADLLEDVGESLSPLIDLGQIEGGFMQGVGWLTIEELLWDADGRLSTDGASTYKIPSLSELPPVLNVSFLERASEPGVVFGSKAVGEPPLMLAISVREAIRDAIAAFGDDGIVTLDSPATPERIYWAIEHAREKQPSSELRLFETSMGERLHHGKSRFGAGSTGRSRLP